MLKDRTEEWNDNQRCSCRPAMDELEAKSLVSSVPLEDVKSQIVLSAVCAKRPSFRDTATLERDRIDRSHRSMSFFPLSKCRPHGPSQLHKNDKAPFADENCSHRHRQPPA